MTWGKALGVVAVALAAGCAAAAADWPEIVLEERLTGFDQPVAITHAGDGSGRLFVVEQEGRIRVISAGQALAEPFLDIASRVSCCGERGLLGLAFPPGFSKSRRFYVNYTNNAGDTVVSRFAVGDDPDRADPASEQVLLTIDQPFANHNGGGVVFGPDGFLYIGMGDGGSAGDPQNNAQDPLSLLGKLLRIDVESSEAPYRIPASNPFAGDPGYRPEIWALGLRNPWRFAFDGLTGGHVSRGHRWPRLDGVYLYGDYCSGRIWGLRRSAGEWEHRELDDTGLQISTFGVDELGTVWVADHGTGRLFAITDPGVEEPQRLLVPAVAHLAGAGGTPWRTDLAVLNPTSQDAAMTFILHRDGPELSAEAVLPAGSSTEWRDVLDGLFGLGGDTQMAGTVEILSDVPVVATARSYAASQSGTFGQHLPALQERDGLGAGEPGLLLQLTRSAERYTNLGAVNLGSGPCAISVRLHAADGSPLGAPFGFDLAPAEWHQFFDVLAAAGEQLAAWARVEVLTPEGRAWAYASIIDRVSRDPTTVPIQRAR